MFYVRIFRVTDCKELFTVYDYKRLLGTVEEHINMEYESKGLEIGTLRVYYNPEQNEGIAWFMNTKEECMVSDMEFPYGNDFIIVQFN